MGRAVILDDAVHSFLRSLVTGKLLKSGLIIGQATAAKDYVLHLATTPKQDVQGSVPSINIPADLSPTSAVGGMIPTGSKDSRGKTEEADLLDEKWISQHVKQVTRMLPGGLDVLGIFVAAPPDTMQSLQPRFRQCDAKPADLKFQSISSKWHQINTKLSVDWRVPITIETLATSLMKQLQMEGKKMTKPLVCECGAMLSIRGNVHGRAYVHSKASVKEAVKALKTDLVRTLVSRCVILCEDESIYEHEQDPSTVLETPMRVFVPLPGTNLTVCDYIFNGESSADSVEPFKELLGIDVSSEKVESDCESFPGEEDLQDEQLSRCSSESELEIVKKQARSYLWVLISILVAIGAVVASYFYLRIPEHDDKK